MPRNSTRDDQVKEQFIAGVRCSSCQQLDTTLWIHGQELDQTRCVSCGFESNRPKPAELGGLTPKRDESTESSADFKPVTFKP